VRLPLDVLIAFTANPEDYTARGKIITPLKDRIGAEIRTHYMSSRADALSITEQEAWVSRGTAMDVPRYVREVVEEIAFQARGERKIDKRSGVSQRMPISVLETAISNAERRALANGESPVVPRVTDVYAALPSMTGKFELEYEGELKGADQVGRDLVRAAVASVFDAYFGDADTKSIIEWFDLGGSLSLSDTTDAATLVKDATAIQGLVDLSTSRAGIDRNAPAPAVAAAIDFLLEGLYSQKKISRSDVRGYHGAEPVRRPQPQQPRSTVLTPDDEEDGEQGGGGGKKKKRYYN
jgi:magnesium chelatase subunit I